MEKIELTKEQLKDLLDIVQQHYYNCKYVPTEVIKAKELEKIIIKIWNNRKD